MWSFPTMSVHTVLILFQSCLSLYSLPPNVLHAHKNLQWNVCCSFKFYLEYFLSSSQILLHLPRQLSSLAEKQLFFQIIHSLSRVSSHKIFSTKALWSTIYRLKSCKKVNNVQIIYFPPIMSLSVKKKAASLLKNTLTFSLFVTPWLHKCAFIKRMLVLVV